MCLITFQDWTSSLRWYSSATVAANSFHLSAPRPLQSPTAGQMDRLFSPSSAHVSLSVTWQTRENHIMFLCPTPFYGDERPKREFAIKTIHWRITNLLIIIWSPQNTDYCQLPWFVTSLVGFVHSVSTFWEIDLENEQQILFQASLQWLCCSIALKMLDSC